VLTGRPADEVADNPADEVVTKWARDPAETRSWRASFTSFHISRMEQASHDFASGCQDQNDRMH
jgi:hypothetical protein